MAIAIIFCRWTIAAHNKEPPALRFFFALLMGFLAYSKKNYELICAVHIFSYAVPMLLTANKGTILEDKMLRLGLIALSGFVSFLLSHVMLSKEAWKFAVVWTPVPFARGLKYLFSITEIAQAYDVLLHFMEPPS